MRTSLLTSLYTQYALKEAIKQITVAGFDAVEIWGGRPHAYCNDLHEHDILQLRELIDALGLETAAFVPAQYRYPYNLCSPTRQIRMDSVQYLKQCIELAFRLGAPVVKISPGHTIHEQDLDNGWDLLADSLIRICEFSVNYNVLLALEPCDKYESDLINTSLQAMDMIDQLGCDNLGVSFNSGHAFIAGEDPTSAIENLGDRLFHVHVNDNDSKEDQHLVPGHGQYNFRTLIQALRMNLYDGFISADLGWQYTIDPDPAAVDTQEFLENLINE